jgi:hypothetical protein
MLKNASIKEIVKNTIVKFTSRTFFLSAVWVFVAMFILIRDGDVENKPAALMCIGCAVATTLVYCITRSKEKRFEFQYGKLKITASADSSQKGEHHDN